jgi:hypothetical protein
MTETTEVTEGFNIIDLPALRAVFATLEERKAAQTAAQDAAFVIEEAQRIDQQETMQREYEIEERRALDRPVILEGRTQVGFDDIDCPF